MHSYIIVDDEYLVRQGTRKKLEPLSDVVECVGEAGNGKEALELIEKKDPQIIITDMNMPIMDGSTLLGRLSECYPEKAIIVISGYKDFEYAKKAISSNAINYILKPFSKEELQESIQQAILQIENKNEITTRLEHSETEKETVKYEYDLQLVKNMLHGYSQDDLRFSSQKMMHLVSYPILLFTAYSKSPLETVEFQNLLTEQGLDDLSISIPGINSVNMHFIIVFSPKNSIQRLGEVLSQCFKDSKKFNSYSLGISDVHDNLSELHTAYLETIAALNSRLIGKDFGCYYFSVQQEPVKEVQWLRIDELLFRMETGDLEAVKKLMNELFDFFVSAPNCSLYDVKLFCYQISNRARFVMTNYFEQVSTQASSSSVQNIMNSLFSFEEVRNYYVQFFLNITDILQEENVYKIHDPVEKVKIYIERNYGKELSVEFVSSLFYLNRSYLSHLFKSRTKMNYVDYVNKVRIEKAKELIKSNQKKMYQIAKMVGYDNVKYFYRVFKKYEGITPKEYQDQVVEV